MGGGMMRQTLPLIKPERPRVGTGMEKIVARSSGTFDRCSACCVVTRVTGTKSSFTQSAAIKNISTDSF